jgi:hypothetical protein
MKDERKKKEGFNCAGRIQELTTTRQLVRAIGSLMTARCEKTGVCRYCRRGRNAGRTVQIKVPFLSSI